MSVDGEKFGIRRSGCILKVERSWVFSNSFRGNGGVVLLGREVLGFNRDF